MQAGTSIYLDHQVKHSIFGEIDSLQFETWRFSF